MSRDDLIVELKRLAILGVDDKEIAHLKADEALLDFVNDEEIAILYRRIGKYYA